MAGASYSRFDSLIGFVLAANGVSAPRRPVVNFTGLIVGEDDDAAEQTKLTFDPTTTWVVVDTTMSPYTAFASSPWIAVDLRAGDVEVHLWFATEGEQLHIVDLYGAEADGHELTVKTSTIRTPEPDDSRQVISDGNFENMNYSTSATGFGDGFHTSHYRFMYGGFQRLSWVRVDGKVEAGPISNVTSIHSNMPAFGISGAANVGIHTAVTTNMPAFGIVAAVTVVPLSDATTISTSMPAFAISAAATVTDTSTISTSMPAFAISAAAATSIPDPTHISGCKMWMRADLGTTIATGVSQWNDQSGNSHQFVQATGGNQPTVTTAINGHTTIHFNGGSQSMACSDAISTCITSTAYTVFVVYRTDAGIANAQVSSISNYLIQVDLNGEWGQFCAANKFIAYHYDGADQSARPTAAADTDEYATSVCTGGVLSARVNGGSYTTTSVGAVQSVGGTFRFSPAGDYAGHLGEYIVYNRALSADEITLVENYIKTFWGL